MRLIVVDEHKHFSQQTHAYAEYRAFSGLAGTDDRARAITITLERRDAADAEGRVVCTVAVTTGAGEAAEVRAIGRHACAAPGPYQRFARAKAACFSASVTLKLQ